MKVSQRKINMIEKEITYTYIENGSPAVCFMFSGAGYTYDKPLFYYSTMTMLQNGFDVVHIHYSYEHDMLRHPMMDITKVMVQDCTLVIDEVCQNKDYQETMFLGKSLGTIPIINGFMKNERYIHAKMILLTPLLKFDSIFEGIMSSNHITHLVIGEKDTHFNRERIQRINAKTSMSMSMSMSMSIVTDANHSLDIEPFNASGSIMALDSVMKGLAEFVKIKN
ncbi:alpha/beta family hydrolase [Peribacillus muralis]|uniref:alpha/beta family hydrolase n=1 Tax=Peribacillus muralis TaxID=264697 RepID=UPI00366F60AB